MKKLLLVLVLAICRYGKSDVPSQASMLNRRPRRHLPSGETVVKCLSTIDLSVYYESKCPDSMNFIVDHLEPAVSLLGDHLKVHLWPFGKAHSINNGEGGFECQHGPSECLGNLVQNCALHHMQDRTDYEKVSYVKCEMTSLAGTTGDLTCARNMNLPINWIEECVNSEEGIELQLLAEDATNILSPQFIPTITTNDEFNEQIQKQALEDLIGMLCSMMKNIPPCAEHYNHQALEHVLV